MILVHIEINIIIIIINKIKEIDLANTKIIVLKLIMNKKIIIILINLNIVRIQFYLKNKHLINHFKKFYKVEAIVYNKIDNKMDINRSI